MLRDAGGEAAQNFTGHWHSALKSKIVQFHLDAIMFSPEVVAWQVDGLHFVSPQVHHLPPNLLAKEFPAGWTRDTQITAHGLSKSR